MAQHTPLDNKYNLLSPGRLACCSMSSHLKARVRRGEGEEVGVGDVGRGKRLWAQCLRRACIA